MAQTVSLLLSVQRRAGLGAVIEDRRRPVKHVQRAQIVLLSADHLPVLEIAKRVGVSRPMVWRWHVETFAYRYNHHGPRRVLGDRNPAESRRHQQRTSRLSYDLHSVNGLRELPFRR